MPDARAARAARAAAVVLLLALGTVPARAHSNPIDEKIQAQQDRVNAVHQQLITKRRQLDDAAAKVGSVSHQLDVANANIAAVQASLGTVEAQMRSTEKKLAWNRTQLAAAQATLARHDAALQRRLVEVYERGDLGYVAVLMASTSFDDFLERWNDVRYVIRANEVTIRARRAAADQVAAIQRGLLADEANLRNAQAAADQQVLALSALAQQRRNLLAVAEAQKQDVAVQVSQLDDMSAAAEAALEALVREKQAEEEAKRAAARRAALLAGASLPPEPGAPGQLAWPVSGPISSPFGMRMHPVYGRPILHAGIDIAVPQGTTIGAAADGKVIVAGYQGDCGNMVALDNFGGLSTIYCHMSQIFVGVGQDVQRGQAIGAVGMTGDATGPHLHFQVMLNGHPVDPMSYLR